MGPWQSVRMTGPAFFALGTGREGLEGPGREESPGGNGQKRKDRIVIVAMSLTKRSEQTPVGNRYCRRANKGVAERNDRIVPECSVLKKK